MRSLAKTDWGSLMCCPSGRGAFALPSVPRLVGVLKHARSSRSAARHKMASEDSNSAKHFHRRLVVLIDAKAILGAACNGRSSARTLRGIMRQLGSLLLATNSLLRLVYIPSEHNPADAPSRGRRKRRQAQRRKQSYKTHVGPALVSRVRQVVSSVQTLQEVWGPGL